MRELVAGQTAGAQTRSLRLIKFGLVGLSGYVVNTGALALFSDLLGIHYLIGAAMATQASTAWNYGFTDSWVYGSREASRGHVARFAMFWVMNNTTLVLRLPLMWLLTSLLGVHYLVSNLISLGVITIARFWASDEFIWGSS